MKKLHGYMVWFIATLFVVYAFCLNTASAVFFDAIKTSLHASKFGVSVATGAFILGFACLQIPAGYLLDKFNVRFVISSGILLLALGNILISFSDNLVLYTCSNFIQGVGASFAFTAAVILISQWFPTKSFPIMFGLTQTLACILAGVLHYYFTVALTTHTWNNIYRCLALFGFSLLALALLIVTSPPNYTREKCLSLGQSLSTVLKNKQILLCSLASATSFGVLLAYAGLWYTSVQRFYSVDNLEAVFISGLIFFGIGVGTPFWGWISNLVKSRVMVIHVTLCLGTMALILGIYLPRFSINTLLITHVISFFIGFFLSGSMLFFTIVSELSSNTTRGVAISFTNTVVFLFNTLMLFIPVLFITTFSTTFYTHLWVLPFFIIISILLLYFIKDSHT